MTLAVTNWINRRSAIGASIALVLSFQAAVASAATTIVFIGNSFTYGEGASVQSFRTNTVTDLNGGSIGGVPALFKAFTQQAGLDYAVSLETAPGANLDFHYSSRLSVLDRAWDVVVMHGHSTLDIAAPNNPAKISQYTGLLGQVFEARNPSVRIGLTATWSRADLTYQTNSPWFGKPIQEMGIDVHAGYEVARANNPTIVDFISPVGLAWNRAFNQGVADTNPYNGITPGLLNLWASDSYHASNYGYYLHALVVFGMVTGADPRTLGGGENAAAELGFTPGQASALQSIAFQQISAVPEPASWGMAALGLGVLLLRRRHKSVRREPSCPSLG